MIMKKLMFACGLVFLMAVCMGADECGGGTEAVDRDNVDRQQDHYSRTQPLPFFDYSLQRDVYMQIYRATNEARQTYTVVESITGQTKWHCPSVGYGIPADTSLTNPLRPRSEYRARAFRQRAGFVFRSE